MFKDTNVWAAPATYTTMTESNLYPATDNHIQDGTSVQQLAAQTGLAEAQGWYIDFDTGEKVVSEAVLYNYAVMFTTYSAERSGELAACEARSSVGASRFYAVNMTNAAAVFAGLGGNEDSLDGDDRSMVLSIAGLPPTPSLLFPETDDSEDGNVLDSMVTAMVGVIDVYPWPMQLIPIWWEEVIND
jgi:type IV pilus assembly protein PilY1